MSYRSGTGATYSELRCDPKGMSCLCTLLHQTADQRHLLRVSPNRTDHLRHAGFFGHAGIGDPARYFYIDAWTMMPRSVFRHRRVRSGYRAILEEKQRYAANRTFTPVYLTHDPIPSAGVVPRQGVWLLGEVLWPDNFFRQLYFGAAATATCQYWLGAAYCGSSLGLLLFDRPGQLLPRLGWAIDRIGGAASLTEIAILGVSKRALLPELAIMTVDQEDLSLMSTAYRHFGRSLARALSADGPCPAIDRVLVHRRDSRSVLNWALLARTLAVRPVILEDLGLARQICTLRRSRLVLAVHGAALGHLFFLQPGRTTVVELFPCVFKKTIYRNLALVMGIEYRWWQAGRPSDCPRLPPGQVDWTSLASKHSFRQQSFYVDPDELRRIIDFAVPGPKDRYLVYMPWEQFNNQLISLRAACGTARLLNRVLVVPELGYLGQDDARLRHRRRVYDPREYVWQPLSRYYNSSALYDSLPCRTVPFSAFYGSIRSVDRIYFRRLGARFNRREQPEAYYYFVAGLYYRHHRSLPYEIPIYNDSPSILRFLGRYGKSLPILALGNVFWLYTFDQPLAYPLRAFHDMMASPTYRQIARALSSHNPHLVSLARQTLSSPRPAARSGVLHWRRGDYREKCASEPLDRQSCYPSLSRVLRRLLVLDPDRAVDWLVISNVPSDRLISVLTGRGFRVRETSDGQPLGLDPIERAIVDQMVAVEADLFLGNYYSSFTRTIFDMRVLCNKTSHFFSETARSDSIPR